MDKAVIIGTYEFIGFHLCLALLEKGVEVTGIHLSSLGDENYLEEKQLNVGRNSNFSEKDESFIKLEQTWPEKTVFFIDYYSYYCRHKEKELKEIMEQLNMNHSAQCIMLMPIQLCHDRVTEDKSFPRIKRVELVKEYYLPTIYGPWQPVHFTFQQALHHPDKPITVGDREWTEDAIFINDVIDYILSQTEEKENRKILLKSTIKEHWQKAAALLLMNSQIVKVNKEMKYRVDVLVVDVGGTVLTEGVEVQKRHTVRLKQMK